MKVRSWRTHDTNYSLSRHILPFLQDNPFYAEISRGVQKRCTRDIPTAAVSYDPESDELVLWYNDVFMAGGSYTDRHGRLVEEDGLSNWETRGVITHEFNHPIFGHLGARRREPHDLHNIATDLANNSLIMRYQGQPRDKVPDVMENCLPRMALVPGVRPYIDPKRLAALTPEQRKASLHLANLIEQFPTEKASEWYFGQLMDDRSKHPDMYPGDGDSIIISLDDHDGWDEVPEDMQEYIDGKIKAIVEKAVRHADSHADGWGTIPGWLREEIRRSVSTTVNWRSVLRQFLGTLVRGHRSPSIKRINRRYPYVHPGVKRGYEAKLIIAIDESGSVDDEMLQMFFGELDSLTRKVDITILHFDCSCDESDLYEWKRGTRPALKRERNGGTNFDAPTALVNDPRNRGRWDGMLIMTDGCAPAPANSRVKRGWVLGQGCGLNFSSDELQIKLSSEKERTGAWF